MNKLTELLAALMQADNVPMSDAWGKLHDELVHIDRERANPIGEVVAWGDNMPPRQGKACKDGAREVLDSEEIGADLIKGPELYTMGLSLTPEYATLAYQVNGGWSIKKLRTPGDANLAIGEITAELATLPFITNLIIASSGIGHYVAHCLANAGQPVKVINMGGEPRGADGDYRFMNYRAKGYNMMLNESEKLYPVFGTANVNLQGMLTPNNNAKLVAKNQNTLHAELPEHYMMLEAMALYYVGPDAVQIDPVRPKCNVCDTELVDDSKKLNFDCGGTCLKCMAEWGDEECARAVREINGCPKLTSDEETER